VNFPAPAGIFSRWDPQTRLLSPQGSALWLEMVLPSEPVTFSVAQMEELNKKLSTMRHDINNQLSLIVAAVELIRHKPHLVERMTTTLAEQPAKISESIGKFSHEFEKAFGIIRG